MTASNDQSLSSPSVSVAQETDQNSKHEDLSACDLSTATDRPLTEQVPYRSHDPNNNLKRSDPFQFGSRYLQEDDNVFEFNAWDHVETDDTYKEYAEVQYAKQREAPVSDFDKSKL